jgi:uncharacterized protein involved in exopolysaccharide biosynthesis
LLVVVVALAAILGAAVGKFLIPKQYRASATVLWEPPAEARADAIRELTTLAQSVKLPENLRAVREKLALETTLEGLSGQIDVVVSDQSMLITISVKAKDRDTCADAANVLVDVFLAAQKEVAASRLRETARALRDSLAVAETSLREARQEYEAFRKEHGVADASVETQAAIEELARLRVAANDAQVELESLRARENSLRASRDVSPSEVVASRNETAPAAARLAEARMQLAEAQAKLTNDHPKVRALEAEVGALEREAATAKPTVTSRTVSRGTMRDNLAAQVEELAALRKSIEQRKSSLAEVLVTAEKRAATLTTAETQAARLLAAVQVSGKHVSSLLEQLATAEDDVRKATSSFQVVSRAAAPPWPEKGNGRIVAAAIPLAALSLVLLFLFVRALWPLRASAACEVAYFSNAPVLWATTWPQGSAQEARNLSREVADAIEPMGGVIAVASLNPDDLSANFVQIVADRLRARGLACSVLDLSVGDDEPQRTDRLESRVTGDQVEAARENAQLVLVVAPPIAHIDCVRALRRWIDALVVLVPASSASPTELLTLRKSLGIDRGSLGMVATEVPAWLLSPGTRAFGKLHVSTDWKSVTPPSAVPK